MKNPAMLLSPAVIAAILAGCTPTIKTENEVTVRPIQITLDVNLRVDRELNRELNGSQSEIKPDPASSDVRERRRARRERILAWKSAKLIGENNAGLLDARSELSEAVRRVVDEENADRKLVFEKIAASENLPIEAVAQRMSGRMNERTPSGTWVQDAAGNWSIKP